MDYATWFHVVNAVAIIGWAPLLLAPKWKWTRAGATLAVSGLLAVGYVILLLSGLGEADGGFGSLAEVMQLFTFEHAVLLGWVHYLAFDLVVGTWITFDWATAGQTHWWILPVLALTFFLGPAGILAYLILRAAKTRTWPRAGPPAEAPTRDG